MTEGIIQEVINSRRLDVLYTIAHLGELPSNESPNEFVARILRQELIERIKAKFLSNYILKYSPEHEELLNILLGDSKE